MIWVPTLYYTQGYPYTAVMEMAAVFFKAIGVSLPVLGIFAGIFNLPWAFKFVWSPLVELVGTKRGWIRLSQGLICALLVALVYVIGLPVSKTLLSINAAVPNVADYWMNAGFSLGLLVFMFSLGFSMDARRSVAVRILCLALAAGYAVFVFVCHGRIFTVEALSLAPSIWAAFAVFLGIAFMSATQDIAIDGYYLDMLDGRAQSAYSGVRVMFYRVAMVAGSGLFVMIAGLKGSSWSVGFGAGAAVFVLLYVFHMFYLPYAPEGVPPGRGVSPQSHRKSFADAFSSFLDQKRILLILMFIIFFRVDDFLWKPMSKAFLMDIGVSVAQLGFLQGVVGVIATIAGSVLGGFYIARKGLTKSLWTLGIWQSTNLLLYAYLALAHPVVPKGSVISHMSFIHVGVVNALENLAIGLGTIAFVNFLMRTCKKEYTAAHYAICTGLMAVSSMVASFFSGFLAESMGYLGFFLLCFFASIPGLIILAFLPLKDLETRYVAPDHAAGIGE